MNKIKFQYSPYEMELSHPFNTSKGVLTSRKGFIIVLTDENGRRGFGEAAPMPEFGSETYKETEEKLSTLKFNIRIDFNNPAGTLEKNLRQFDKLPALKHGIEQAMLKLICIRKNVSLNELVNKESKSDIPVNAAVGLHTPAETLKQSAAFIQQGYTTIKLKGGRDKFSEDLDRVRLIATEFKDKIKIRLDLNGKWNVQDAIHNLKRLEHFTIEYAEEPVTGFDQFKELAAHSSIPIAPDESIRSFEDAMRFIDSGFVKFIILKPMMIGGLLPVLRIIDYAAGKKVIPIITTSLDTAIGRAFAVFAASTVEHEFAHGLGTGIYFKKDVAQDPYPVKEGRISLRGTQ